MTEVDALISRLKERVRMLREGNDMLDNEPILFVRGFEMAWSELTKAIADEADALARLSLPDAGSGEPVSEREQKLLELAFTVIDWRHEWNEAPLDEEFVATLDALEEVVGDWTP